MIYADRAPDLTNQTNAERVASCLQTLLDAGINTAEEHNRKRQRLRVMVAFQDCPVSRAGEG